MRPRFYSLTNAEINNQVSLFTQFRVKAVRASGLLKCPGTCLHFEHRQYDFETYVVLHNLRENCDIAISRALLCSFSRKLTSWQKLAVLVTSKIYNRYIDNTDRACVSVQNTEKVHTECMQAIFPLFRTGHGGPESLHRPNVKKRKRTSYFVRNFCSRIQFSFDYYCDVYILSCVSL